MEIPIIWNCFTDIFETVFKINSFFIFFTAPPYVSICFNSFWFVFLNKECQQFAKRTNNLIIKQT